MSNDVHYDQNIFDETLIELNKVLKLLSGKCITDFGLPIPTNMTNLDTTSAEYTRETSYDQSRLLQVIAQDEHRMNTDKKKVYDALMSSINSNEVKTFFSMLQKAREKHS